MSSTPLAEQLLELWAHDAQQGFVAAIEALKTDRWHYVAWDLLLRGLVWQQNYTAALDEAGRRIDDLLVAGTDGAAQATRAAYHIANLVAFGAAPDGTHLQHLETCMRPFMVAWEAVKQGELSMENCLYLFIPNAIETANALERAADLRIPHHVDYDGAAAQLRSVVFQMLEAYTAPVS